MKLINSQIDFDSALKAENAVIFIYFPWSEHSLHARRLVEKWEHELMCHGARPKFDICLLEPDAHPYTWKWVAKNATLAGDSENIGETLLWLRQGAVAGGLQNIVLAEVKTFSRMTDECFVHGKQLGLSTPPPEPPVFDTELLNILCCPETHQKLQLAASQVLEKLNQQIVTGRVCNRSGRTVDEQVAAGLVRSDGKYLYPMQQNIPILLMNEAIPLTR